MDDFEQRLSQGLGREASGLPAFQGDLGTVARRGRNRKWAVRGASGFSALVILAGGLVAYQALQDEPVELTRTADDTGVDDASDGGPDPTDESVGVDGDQGAVDPGPIEVEPLPALDPPVDDGTGSLLDGLVVGAGWGVGIIDDGNYYAEAACCTDDPWAWPSADTITEDGEVIRPGAVRAFSDGIGGLVHASTSALVWTSADRLGQQDPVLIDSVPLLGDDGNTHELTLWDVGPLDGTTTAIYSKTTFSADGGGSSELIAWGLDGSRSVLESSSWSSTDDPAWVHYRGASAAGDRVMVLRSAGAGACEWLDLLDATGNPARTVARYPRPEIPAGAIADGSFVCPNPSLESAAMADDGISIAVVEADDVATSPKRVIIFEPDGATVRYESTLPDAGPGTEWSEIDYDGSTVVTSIGIGLDPADWQFGDATRLFRTSNGRVGDMPVPGAPALLATPPDLTAIEAVEADDDRWFSGFGNAVFEIVIAEPEPEPTPEPVDDPPPSSEPTVPVNLLSDEQRTGTGRLNVIVASGQFTGDDGCFDPVGDPTLVLCVGEAFATVADKLTAIYGPEATNDPATFLEGDPHPAGTHVWVGGEFRITIEVDDEVDLVRSISARPETAAGVDGAPWAPGVTPTFADVIAVLGPPAEIFQGVGEGQWIVSITYDTDDGYITYSHVRFDDEGLVVADGFQPMLAVEYETLPVNAYRADPQG